MKPIGDKAIVRHTLTVYEALANESRQEGEYLIFRGKVTRVFASTGIGQSYYSEIFRQLEGQSCISYLQRGSKSVDSVIVMHEAPTSDGYIAPTKSPLTDPERYANLQESVKALETLVGGVNIPIALKEVERRLKDLEKLHNRQESSVTSHQQVEHKER